MPQQDRLIRLREVLELFDWIGTRMRESETAAATQRGLMDNTVMRDLLVDSWLEEEQHWEIVGGVVLDTIRLLADTQGENGGDGRIPLSLSEIVEDFPEAGRDLVLSAMRKRGIAASDSQGDAKRRPDVYGRFAAILDRLT